jgi:EAL domain-containing protein (putative c-di-GMP-specific phosphodiesterase class I)/CheY-like chemotaxis protein
MGSASPTTASEPTRVLVVDDDPAVRFTFAALLQESGHVVETADGGKQAVARLAVSTFDVVVSDIRMPDIDGIQLLSEVRARDLDLPVILVTGGPGLDTALKAVEHGAFRYLLKPVDSATLIATVEKAARLNRVARWKREALAHMGIEGRGIGDIASLELTFGRALASLRLAGQPIVRAREGSLFGIEALARTDEALLASPTALFEAAERLHGLHRIGAAIRDLAAAAPVPDGVLLFVNMHAAELLDERVFDRAAPLSGRAGRVVIELTERASLERIPDLRGRVRALRDMGFRLALDDLGAGYAGLTSFASLEPDIVKLDMSLVRGIDSDAVKQRLVGTMVELCRDLRTQVVAEGIQTEAERRTITGLGCDLLQGYLLGWPVPLVPARPPSPPATR